MSEDKIRMIFVHLQLQMSEHPTKIISASEM